MRRLVVSCTLVGSLLLAACSGEAPAPGGEQLGNASDEIINGSPDTVHKAVVAVLGQQSECTGTIVQVKGSTGYVLTAAHCCEPQDPLKWVVLGDDYNSNKSLVYDIIPGSMKADPAFGQDAQGGLVHDFCMVQFSGASANTPVIPAMTKAQDQLVKGTVVDFVGYGITQNGNNSIRNHKTGALAQVSTYVVAYNQTAQGNNGGPCSGDSGGPALTTSGPVLVAAVTSYGDQNCAQYGVSGRVSSAYDSFIGPYLAGQPIQPPPETCDTCSTDSTSQGGACSNAVDACLNDAACLKLVQCFQGCSTDSCYQNCTTQNVKGLPKYVAIQSCVCDTACANLCGSESFCTSAKCGLGATDANCDSCIESKCCAESYTCAVDGTCPSCFGDNPPASCGSNGAYNGLLGCLQNKCNNECGGGSSSSSSSSSSTGSGGITTSSSGGGADPSGGVGGGAPGAGGGDPSGNGGGDGETKDDESNTTTQDSGLCSVSAPGSARGSTFGGESAVAGLALAALSVLRRRRRSA